MNDLTIQSFQPVSPPEQTAPTQKVEGPNHSFGDYVQRSLEAVNRQMLDADKAIEAFTTGKRQDIHGTMIAMQKAQVSFELVMQIRNKLVSAYDEIRRMSI